MEITAYINPIVAVRKSRIFVEIKPALLFYIVLGLIKSIANLSSKSKSSRKQLSSPFTNVGQALDSDRFGANGGIGAVYLC